MNYDPIDLLVNTVQDLSLAPDLQTLMYIVRKAARRSTGAEGVTFVLNEKNHYYYADEDAIAPLWKGQRFPIHSCISGWALFKKIGTQLCGFNISLTSSIPRCRQVAVSNFMIRWVS